MRHTDFTKFVQLLQKSIFTKIKLKRKISMLAERMNHLGTETAFEVLARANALEAEEDK